MEFDLNKRYCYYFNEISQIPRASRKEKAVSDYIVGFAKDHGLTYRQDDKYNVIIDKPASAGYENAEPVIMQAHIDMVCEKNNDVVHDFDSDPLDLYVEDGWLKARGTTLGADDGYGVSYMLAILEDDTLSHPAISCLFTSMEEIGLLGAAALTADDLHGSRLINLDGGGEKETCVSSSGGATAVIHCPVEYEPNEKAAYELFVGGLQGGHSGGKIHLECGNANTLAVRILKEMQDAGIDLQLADFTGGLKYNAIPREAIAVFVSDAPKEKIEASLAKSAADIKSELEFSDAGFLASLKETTAEKRIVQERSDAFIRFLYICPNGFQHRSMAIEGLTIASLNAGVVRTGENEIVIDNLIRSALESYTNLMIGQLGTLGEMLGIRVDIENRYSGWAYRKDSPLRELLKTVSARHGVEIEEKAAHGGLECGLFAGLKNELDIITYGPIAEGAHTPQEKLDLASFDRAYTVLCELLAECRP